MENFTASFIGFCERKSVIPTFVTYGGGHYQNTPKDVVIPEYIYYNGEKYIVSEISGGAFSYCMNMETLYVPSTVLLIDWNMFYCRNLKAIKVAFNNEKFKDFDGVLFSRDGQELIAYPNAYSDSYNIPYGTRRINNFAFKDCCNLKKITIPDSVKEIGDNAFYRCVLLNEIYIPDGVRPDCIGKYIDGSCKKEPQIYYRGKVYNSINEISLLKPNSNIALFPIIKYKAKKRIIGTLTEKYNVYAGTNEYGEDVEALVSNDMKLLIPFDTHKFVSVNYKTFIVKKGSFMGLVSVKDFEIVLPFCYDSISSDVRGLYYLIKKGDKQGICDFLGNIIIPVVIDRNYYVDINTYSDGMVAATSDIIALESKWGFIGDSGDFVISEKFDSIEYGFSKGFATVRIGNNYIKIDKSGKAINSRPIGFYDFNDNFHLI